MDVPLLKLEVGASLLLLQGFPGDVARYVNPWCEYLLHEGIRCSKFIWRIRNRLQVAADFQLYTSYFIPILESISFKIWWNKGNIYITRRSRWARPKTDAREDVCHDDILLHRLGHPQEDDSCLELPPTPLSAALTIINQSIYSSPLEFFR